MTPSKVFLFKIFLLEIIIKTGQFLVLAPIGVGVNPFFIFT